MRRLNFLKILFLLFISLRVFAGGSTVGNGGAFYQCNGSSQFIFIDHFVRPLNEVKFRMDNSWQESLSRVAARLLTHQDQKIREAGKNLQVYSQFVFIDYLPESLWSWLRSEEPLPKMFNPWYQDVIPNYCIFAKQVAHRFGPVSFELRTQISYDGPLIDYIMGQPYGNLEISLFLIHEWLWQFNRLKDNPLKLAEVNLYLHTMEFLEATDTEILSYLQPYF